MPRSLISVLLALVCMIVAHAQDEITTRTLDLRRDRDGNPTARYEITSRGKTRVMMTRLERDGSGAFVPRSRAYYVGHALVAIESDENRDGFFETLILRDHSGTEVRIEGFIRSPDGSVRPMDAAGLDRLKATESFWNEFWDQALPTK